MEYWSLEDEIETRVVAPARDAERSAFTFNDYGRDDPRSYPNCLQEETSSLVYQRSLAPIGVFDSGVGGFTILSELRRELPHENYIYFGDTAHLPYGARTEEDITELALKCCRFLLEQGVKLIVVACNTASQAALNTLRATFSVPFIGVVPAVKPAARITKSGRIGIAATESSAQAAYLRQLIDEFATGIETHAIGCPELVTLVERGELEGPQVEETLRQTLRPLLESKIDVLVLGCTHFPALRPAIERVIGKRIQIVDSAAAIARRMQAVLDTEGLLHPATVEEGRLQVWCSGDVRSFSEVASRILGYPVLAHQWQF